MEEKIRSQEFEINELKRTVSQNNKSLEEMKT